jgi:CDP-3, 6-dideoxy-D-glycero-L-glycero-4-hexulose-4-reductase
MKTYVIGANGFLGSHLARRFNHLGLVRAAPKYREDASDLWQTQVLRELRDFAPNLVMMPGASQAMGDDEKAIHSLIASNCVLPCLVAQLLLEVLPQTMLVVFGTSWQFSDSAKYRPFNLYAASKQAGQDLLAHYALRGLKALQLIMFDTYGESDTRPKLLNILKNSCASDEEIGTTPGDQEIDLVHIDDICEGVVLAVDELVCWDPASGLLVLGLGSGNPITVKELFKRVGQQLGKPLLTRVGERAYRPREVMYTHRIYRRPKGWVPRRTEYHDVTVLATSSKS